MFLFSRKNTRGSWTRCRELENQLEARMYVYNKKSNITAITVLPDMLSRGFFIGFNPKIYLETLTDIWNCSMVYGLCPAGDTSLRINTPPPLPPSHEPPPPPKQNMVLTVSLVYLPVAKWSNDTCEHCLLSLDFFSNSSEKKQTGAVTLPEVWISKYCFLISLGFLFHG